jgi:hypothetical protein
VRVLPAPTAWRTTAVRQSLRALAWTLGLTLAFTAWYAVEKWGFRLDKHDRLVRSPAIVPMVALGVPHFLIAALFLATSPRQASAVARLRLLGLLALGAGLAWAYGAAGAQTVRHRLPIAGVMLLFVVHQLRDEAWLFRAYGDGPPGVDPERTRRFADAWTGALLLGIGGGFLGGLEVWNASHGRIGFVDLVAHGVPVAARAAAFAAGGLAAAVLRLAAWRRSDPDGIRTWLGRIGPLLAVQATFLGVVLAGTVARTLLEALVLWHVMSWMLFALHRIDAGAASAAASPPSGWLERAKRTRRGFLELHLGLAAVVFAAMLAWGYGTGKDPASALRLLADPDAFYYWTILHVVTSFAPRAGWPSTARSAGPVAA